MQDFHKDCGGVGGELCLDPQRERDGQRLGNHRAAINHIMARIAARPRGTDAAEALKVFKERKSWWELVVCLRSLSLSHLPPGSMDGSIGIALLFLSGATAPRPLRASVTTPPHLTMPV